MSRILGFIGGGNMGQAMMGGIIGANIFAPEHIMVADLNEKCLHNIADKYGVKTTTSNVELATASDILILAVKPNLYPIVIEGIKDVVKDDVIIVTIAAGRDIASTVDSFGKDTKVIRVMPNTPALVGEGMSGVCANSLITEKELQEVLDIFSSFGKVEVIGEYLMDVVTAVSGSAPAYIFMIIEAMADAAVLDGMPRDKAYTFAAQTVLGSAKMVLETGMHPGLLKDMVCSPGGTTIEAVATLEKKGLRTALISAMQACTKKSKALSQK